MKICSLTSRMSLVKTGIGHQHNPLCVFALLAHQGLATLKALPGEHVGFKGSLARWPELLERRPEIEPVPAKVPSAGVKAGLKVIQLSQAGLLKEVPIRLNRPGPYSSLGTTSRYATGRHGPLRDHQHSRGIRPILSAGSSPTPSLG